ncbi:hypothetical protein Dxin01_02824 [Deinococcus xinjiangensis]|uniref:LXG domain-containing protein n=1 Tax=Deinococcus xinjiangensis TaxID=457454 RepID=A0ABP9VFQ8_9DEIO
MSKGGFHITIGHGLGDGSDLNLQGEVEMAKLAALYGDSAILISLKAKTFSVMRESMQGSLLDWDIARMRHVAGGEITQVFDQFDSLSQQFQDAMRQMQEIESKASRSVLRSDPNYLKLKHMMKNSAAITAQARGDLDKIFRQFKYDEIEKLTNAGFLSLGSDSELGIGSDMTEAFFNRIFDIFNKSALTYPLFDDDTAEIVRLGIKEGKIAPSQFEALRSKQISLPADFLSRLPNFSQASVKEILDIRKALARPLVRFRAAVIEYSGEIEDAAWDRNFSQDAEILYNKRVAPAILEIEEAIEDNSIRRHIFSNVLTKGAASGLFSLVVSNIDAFTDILGKSGGSLIGAGLGTTATIFSDYQSQNSKISRNGVYFLYKVKKRLENI